VPCGNTGVCNGAGACSNAPNTKQCAPGGCKGAKLFPPSYCDGAGNCVGRAAESCGNYVCDNDGTCRVSCTSDAHCTDSRKCREQGRWKNTCRPGGGHD
jgi:hypothetical protein